MVVYSAEGDYLRACDETANIDFRVMYHPWHLRYTTTIDSADCTISLNYDSPDAAGGSAALSEQLNRLSCLSAAHKACVQDVLVSDYAPSVQSLAPNRDWLKPETLAPDDVPYDFLYFDEVKKHRNVMLVNFDADETVITTQHQQDLEGLASWLNRKEYLDQHIVIESHARRRAQGGAQASAVSHRRAQVIHKALVEKGIAKSRIFIAAFGSRFEKGDTVTLRWRTC